MTNLKCVTPSPSRHVHASSIRTKVDTKCDKRVHDIYHIIVSHFKLQLGVGQTRTPQTCLLSSGCWQFFFSFVFIGTNCYI